MLAQGNKQITLAPLLRTRELLPFEVCLATWTLYQPSALIIWDYDFWGGSEHFSKVINNEGNKFPHVDWEANIPPPFLADWKDFIMRLKKKGTSSRDFDKVVLKLLPMFVGLHIKLPIRILSETEVLRLSGLEACWQHTALEEAEKLSEKTIRDFCGNCFHPEIISRALGSDQTIRNWINGETEGPKTIVADKNTVLRVYTFLCQEVDKLGIRHGYRKASQLSKSSHCILIQSSLMITLNACSAKSHPGMPKGSQTNEGGQDYFQWSSSCSASFGR